jgi:DNA invertase Pin-like site-specific DNA recombinase
MQQAWGTIVPAFWTPGVYKRGRRFAVKPSAPDVIRVALYARVSTVNKGQDVGLQLDELRQVAAQRGWVVAEERVYVDDGVSGATESRPALDRLLADAQAGRFDLVAVWKLDRLGRSLQHLLRLLDDLARWGVGFASLRDSGIDTTTPTGRLILQILGALAEYERGLIRERVNAGIARAKAQGKHCGRPRVDLELRPAVAMLKEGRGLREVAKILGVSRSTLRRRLQEDGGWPAGGPEQQVLSA